MTEPPPRRPPAAASGLGPPSVASAALLLLTLAGGWAALQATGGRPVLPLDDPYIHVAIARTLADHGTWGIQPGQFASASSSPLWVLLLSVAGALTSWGAMLPLVLNAIGVVFLIAILNRFLEPVVPEPGGRAVALGAIGVLAAVPAVAFSGTEHVLHAAAFFALLRGALSALAGGPARRPHPLWLALLASVAVGLRFETLFAGLPLLALALTGRAWRAAAALAIGSAAPVAVHAGLAIPRGGSWLPNPLLIKGTPPDLSSWTAVVSTLARVPRALARPEAWHVTALLLALALLALRLRSDASRGEGSARPHRRLCAVVAVTLLLHVQLAALGSFYRYELYLLVAGLAAAVSRLPALAAPARGGWRRTVQGIAAGALVALAALLALRAGDSLRNMPTASRNIWEQQIQMADFVRARRSAGAVAVNDVGAVALLGGKRVVDILGLADDEVARTLQCDRPGPAVLADLLRAREADLLIAYEEWLGRWGGPPAGWWAVESWEIRGNVVGAGPVVTFFAPDERSATELREELEAFAPRLPRAVSRVPARNDGRPLRDRPSDEAY